MKLYLNLFTLLFSLNSFSQIWDYPPEPTQPYVPNTNIKRTNVKMIKTIEYKLINGSRTNEKSIYCEQKLDLQGKTIYFTVDTSKFFVKNDSILKLFSNILNDNLSRPIKQIIGKQVKTWKYKGDKLVEYTISISDELVESRFYHYHDSVLKYSICYPDIPSKSCVLYSNFESKSSAEIY